jgi:hypothetical protein
VVYVNIYSQNGGSSPWLLHRLEAYATLTLRSVERFFKNTRRKRTVERRLSAILTAISVNSHKGYLIAPPVVPLAMYFWIKKPMTIIGTMVRVAAALLLPQSTEMEPTNFEIPTGSV